MINVVLEAGDSVKITLAGSDGEFIVSFAGRHKNAVTVEADMPDTQRRQGVIYSEEFGSYDDSTIGLTGQD